MVFAVHPEVKLLKKVLGKRHSFHLSTIHYAAVSLARLPQTSALPFQGRCCCTRRIVRNSHSGDFCVSYCLLWLATLRLFSFFLQLSLLLQHNSVSALVRELASSSTTFSSQSNIAISRIFRLLAFLDYNSCNYIGKRWHSEGRGPCALRGDSPKQEPLDTIIQEETHERQAPRPGRYSHPWFFRSS